MADRNYLLDGLRGVAALIVVSYHMQADPSGGAYLAVDFFFGLSGFVIAAAYDARFTAGMGFGGFMRLRVIRLYPLLALGIFLGTVVRLVAPDPQLAGTATAVVFNGFMLPNPFAVDYSALDGPAWSLFCELAVNVAYAAILVRAPSLVIAALMAVAAGIMIDGATTFATLNVGWWWATLPVGLARVLFSFGAGMLLARYARPIDRRRSAAAIMPAAVLALCLLLPVPDEARAVADLVAVFAVFPMLLWVGARLDVPASARRLCARLGDMSYPIYVIHGPLVPVFCGIGPAIGLPPWLANPVGLVAAITSAMLAGELVDKPARRWLSEQRWRRRVEPVAP